MGRVGERDIPDVAVPTLERQVYLREAYEANKAEKQAPYRGVEIKTLGELRWIVTQRGWSGDHNEYDIKFGLYPAGTSTERIDLREAQLAGINLNGVRLRRALLSDANLVTAQLIEANLEDAVLSHAHLGETVLNRAIISNCDLSGAHLRSSTLIDADIRYSTLVATRLVDVDLCGADLRGSRLDASTVLNGARLDSRSRLYQVIWDGAPVSQISWEPVKMLGDELFAHSSKNQTGKDKSSKEWLEGYGASVQSYRQLAVALRSQGLNEDADRFAYRAQMLQREVLRRQGHALRWLGSLLLDLVSGYGYKPLRSVVTYILVVLAFAAGYFALTNPILGPAVSTHTTPLQWYEAIVLSISSFHGRGLFPPGVTLNDPIAILAAGEAVLGLLIEIIFIATFTQRFFAR